MWGRVEEMPTKRYLAVALEIPESLDRLMLDEGCHRRAHMHLHQVEVTGPHPAQALLDCPHNVAPRVVVR
jgi:hypothetical protein